MVCSPAVAFEFPIVDGIPLLSLAAGFGGAEEELQPYVPLQIAAIKHLQRNDVNGLRTWIARHMPLAAALMEGHFRCYLDFRAASNAQLDLAIVRHLAHYEALGVGPPRKGWRNLARRVYHRLRGAASPAIGNRCSTIFTRPASLPRGSTRWPWNSNNFRLMGACCRCAAAMVCTSTYC